VHCRSTNFGAPSSPKSHHGTHRRRRQIGRSNPSKRTATMPLSPLAVQQPNNTMKIWVQ
ncbi:hypothetical protein ACLOJK_029227, partial [Asimina triloba]